MIVVANNEVVDADSNPCLMGSCQKSETRKPGVTGVDLRVKFFTHTNSMYLDSP